MTTKRKAPVGATPSTTDRIIRRVETPRNPAFPGRYVTEWRAGEFVLAVCDAMPVNEAIAAHFRAEGYRIETATVAQTGHGDWAEADEAGNITLLPA